MKFTVVLGFSRLKLTVESDTLTLDDVLLLVADAYGEEYFGCTVSAENGDFICNAVKEYFEETDAYKGMSVYEIALHNYASRLKIKAGLYDMYYDAFEDSEVLSPRKIVFDELKESKVEE